MTIASEQIKQNIINHLVWDSRVDASDVLVEVEGDHVVLSGTVPAYTARKAALEDALYIDGVNSVENRIAVRYPAANRRPTDEALKLAIENRLSWESAIDSSRLKIRVNEGTVNLEGDVEDWWKRERLESVVSEFAGVRDIVNLVAVVPSRKCSDQDIGRAVYSAFRRMSRLKAAEIEIRIDNGRVTLSGRVPDRECYQAAANAAGCTQGVSEVVNNMEINRM